MPHPGESRASLAVLALLTVGGCYAPHFEDCTVRCGAGGSCPGGLTCQRGFCNGSGGVDCAQCAPACAVGELCCGGGCVAIGPAHCHGCEVTCGGKTPACLDTLGACGCDGASCALEGKDCDPQSGRCVACAEAPHPEDRAELWVAATPVAAPPPAPTGSPGCPYPTISAALAVAYTGTGKPVLRIAPGRYDAALGETFPLELRGVSLAGTGARDQTVIAGDAQVDRTLVKSWLGGTDRHVTLLVGDPLDTTRISGLTLLPGTVNQPQHFGVLCDRGDTTPLGTTPPEANTVLEDLTIGPGFGTGVGVTDSGEWGCNLALRRSELTQNITGLYSGSCWDATLAPRAPVAVRISDGSRFALHRAVGQWAGHGIFIDSCTSLALVADSELVHNDYSVVLATVGGRAHLAITGNLLQGGAIIGVDLRGDAALDTLDDNRFLGITRAIFRPFAAAALVLQDRAVLRHARRNRFIGNDAGVQILGGALTSVGRVVDLGTLADPGDNVFRCNASLPEPNFNEMSPPGYDVRIAVDGSGDGTIGLVGNAWDHAPPHLHTGNVIVTDNGLDLLVTPKQGLVPRLDTRGARLATEICPAGHVVGP